MRLPRGIGAGTHKQRATYSYVYLFPIRVNDPRSNTQVRSMKYYDEEQMGKVRQKLEAKLLLWKNVTARMMMGSPTFFYGRSFFAFLVTKGIVITKLSEVERAKLPKNVRSFAMNGARMPKNWIMIPLEKPEDIQRALPYVKQSYGALSKAK